ncbi:hypothetical protein [Streptomyces sp. MUM 2J]|uniref:hypothetical protein n=1 Tax=Streptomyces sp. MUM 2J TaxID=2791987 RepID=UPI001F047AAD|nr:hypothetical protein [Streptomyces sp. MUM 2J]MCH0566937.1 hypothetical protein [Streptomyces sp. MUM 2J]
MFQCKLCPNKGTNRQIRGVGARMAAYRVCSSCDFWLMCLGYAMLGDHDPDGRRALRIGGIHYLTWTDEQGFPPEIGYVGNGEHRYFLLNDPTGTVHVTRRLWLMGTIPEAFRDRMPDNAAFAPTT